jgi:DNA-directed RNA polymerase subunit N
MAKQELSARNHTDKGEIKMMIPIRCTACGKPLGHLWEEFKERVANGEDRKKVLDQLGLERYCCRALFLGHVDLIDIAGQFKKF